MGFEPSSLVVFPHIFKHAHLCGMASPQKLCTLDFNLPQWGMYGSQIQSLMVMFQWRLYRAPLVCTKHIFKESYPHLDKLYFLQGLILLTAPSDIRRRHPCQSRTFWGLGFEDSGGLSIKHPIYHPCHWPHQSPSIAKTDTRRLFECPHWAPGRKSCFPRGWTN